MGGRAGVSRKVLRARNSHRRELCFVRNDALTSDNMLYFTESDVRRLVPMTDAVRLMREAFSRLASGQAQNHPRRRLVLPSQSVLHYMVAGNDRYFGSKVYSTHPKHGAHFFF